MLRCKYSNINEIEEVRRYLNLIGVFLDGINYNDGICWFLNHKNIATKIEERLGRRLSDYYHNMLINIDNDVMLNFRNRGMLSTRLAINTFDNILEKWASSFNVSLKTPYKENKWYHTVH